VPYFFFKIKIMNKLFIAILLGVFFSCKGTKTTKQTENNQNNEHTSETIYRFNVSFISIGSGTDGIARRQFLDFIKDFETKRNIQIPIETTKWGREGETDYCLKLTQLNSDEQAKFILDIRELLKNSKLVRYSENTICKQTRGKQN
jgi:hypothetical protein